MNIVKTGFFIFLKDHKSSNVFVNFYYNSYKDDFFIPISARSLKAGFNKLNVSKGVTPKSGPYRPKDCHRSEVSKEVNIRNNGFKDPNSWESIERGLHIPEDRPCEPVES